MNLHSKITYLRKEHKMSQLDLAEKLNVSRQAISKWESGTSSPSIDSLKCISTLYNVSIDYLLDDSIDFPPPQNVSALPANSSPQQEVQSFHCQKLSSAVTRVLLILCILAVAFIAVVYVSNAFEKNNDQPIPIEEMTEESDQNDSDAIFSIEW